MRGGAMMGRNLRVQFAPWLAMAVAVGLAPSKVQADWLDDAETYVSIGGAGTDGQPGYGEEEGGTATSGWGATDSDFRAERNQCRAKAEAAEAEVITQLVEERRSAVEFERMAEENLNASQTRLGNSRDRFKEASDAVGDKKPDVEERHRRMERLTQKLKEEQRRVGGEIRDGAIENWNRPKPSMDPWHLPEREPISDSDYDFETPEGTPEWEKLVETRNYYREASEFAATQTTFQAERQTLRGLADTGIIFADLRFAAGEQSTGDSFLSGAMRQAGTPTTRPATSQSGSPGRRQYVTEGADGKPRVQTQHPADKQHPRPHWHDASPKLDPRTKEPIMNDRGQIKYQKPGSTTSTY